MAPQRCIHASSFLMVISFHSSSDRDQTAGGGQAACFGYGSRFQANNGSSLGLRNFT